MITSNKLRNGFFALMYIVFVTLWADSLYEQEKAHEIIVKHDKLIKELTDNVIKMGDLYNVLYTRHMDLIHTHDSLVDIDRVKTKYINGFGYNIDWNKALKLEQ